MSENITSLEIWEDKSKLEEVKKIFAPTLSPTEFQAFVGIGQSTGLNPFLKEIWAVKYGNSAASIFVGRDGYRKCAQKNPEYDWHFVDSIYANDSFKVVNGQPEHDYTLKDRGALIGAYALCMRKGSSRPNYCRVAMSEYSTGQSLWKSKPETMIKKVAEAQVLRMTFQDMFSGTYDESEEFEGSEKGSTVATVSSDTTEDNPNKRLSKKKEPEKVQEVTEAEVEEVKEVKVENIIRNSQMKEICELLKVLGHTTEEEIVERLDFIEKHMKKDFDDMTVEDGEKIISSLMKKIEASKSVEETKVEEVKKTAVEKLGDKANAENKKILDSEEFKEVFGEDSIVEDVKADQQADESFNISEEAINAASEDGLRAMLVEAKAEYMKALQVEKADKNEETTAERYRISAITTKITQSLITQGYGLISQANRVTGN